ncbi:uncharacterized protein GGS25DRAFT_520315 [Hypoxylon fragiforme]|uniref:uncharacterized protein n=1 Tax=Hypoxylon fragiforme TaxID=63214 RepID=UPI0020C6381B|nr:uncharacterized protein GGS25DRAFT_520315 [Hypoxylon fragiforme]KAI2609515.1 hypothetical protein GGS25DRAFT_520315 [Hypoxylon fragiforme]
MRFPTNTLLPLLLPLASTSLGAITCKPKPGASSISWSDPLSPAAAAQHTCAIKTSAADECCQYAHGRIGNAVCLTGDPLSCDGVHSALSKMYGQRKKRGGEYSATTEVTCSDDGGKKVLTIVTAPEKSITLPLAPQPFCRKGGEGNKAEVERVAQAFGDLFHPV